MGRKGGVVIILVGAYRWPPGPRLNADPLPLACFSLATMKLPSMGIQYG